MLLYTIYLQSHAGKTKPLVLNLCVRTLSITRLKNEYQWSLTLYKFNDVHFIVILYTFAKLCIKVSTQHQVVAYIK